MKDPLQEIEEITQKTNHFMGKKTESALSRYPLTFSFLVLFGVISVLHGFENIINKITFLNDRPTLVFVIGLAILIFTGSLYKKLDKNID